MAEKVKIGSLAEFRALLDKFGWYEKVIVSREDFSLIWDRVEPSQRDHNKISFCGMEILCEPLKPGTLDLSKLTDDAI